ncbi:MAG: DUF177 domain-containing protein [Pseudomonadota bacterium]
MSEALERELRAVATEKRCESWLESTVSGELKFAYAGEWGGEIGAQLSVSATVPAVCQRCLEVFELPLAADQSLLLTEDASAVREGYETWELDRDSVKPLDLVDETLVMAMPFAARHADLAECAARVETTPARSDTVRPFADLKAQMAAKKDSP